MKAIALLLIFSSLLLGYLIVAKSTYAHRSGCHRWHSCPSDTGSYVCGDLGYPCQYSTYSDSVSPPTQVVQPTPVTTPNQAIITATTKPTPKVLSATSTSTIQPSVIPTNVEVLSPSPSPTAQSNASSSDNNVLSFATGAGLIGTVWLVNKFSKTKKPEEDNLTS